MSEAKPFSQTLSARLDTVARFCVRFAGAFLFLAIGCYVLTGLLPLWAAKTHPAFAAQIYAACAKTCARVPTHTLLYGGIPMAICARCLALYASFCLGGLFFAGLRPFFPKIRLGVTAVGIFCGPILLDVLTQSVGLRESTNALRILTGVLAGTALAFLVFPLLSDAAKSLKPEE